MFNRRTLAIIKRELKMKLFSRSFILMTLLVPLFMIGIFSIQYLVHSFSEEERVDLILVSDSDEILNKLQNEIFQTSSFKSGDLTARFEKTELDSFKSKLNEIKPDIIAQRITGVVFIPSTSLQSKGVEYYSSNPNNSSLFYKIKPSINKTLVEIYFSARQLTDDEIKFARKDVEINGFRVSSDEKVAEEGYGNRIAMILFSFLLYMALIFSGSMTMNAVVEEKSNKIVEVLLSSASSTELMAGKIMGTVIVEVIQMAIWLSPIVLLISTSWFFIPQELMPQMSFGFILYFLFNYTIALISYVALYATVGAIFDNPQDAQSGVWPLLMLIMIPFFIALGMESNAQSSLAQIASLFPFASLIVMPARMILVEVPLWQILLSVVINGVVLVGIFKLAGKIYRIGILLTGKKPKWSEVIGWLKMSS
ncbi:MAG TPA: ABC transporter permease [Ignavibacteriaceae bacterium]|nr:ABC transporter permease [Ignavibacteriaceae bacterium]HRN27165.1 ABC transporter permease [Ignavibacteriaceae bacterium]HRP93231.1 ABC transporter permease [Ignavibacteriaceae bacterium]